MGNCGSSEGGLSPEQLEEMRHSRTIDKMLRDEEEKQAKEVKMLLLGAGESGKTTILKQMKIIHLAGFTGSETEHYRQQIFTNVGDAMRVALEMLETWGIELDPGTRDAIGSWHKIGLYPPKYLDDGEPYPQAWVRPLKVLWADSAVQQCVLRRNEFPLPENMLYYYPQLDRLFAPSYVPTEQDILRCRGKTTGITETSFLIKGLTYRMFDVGGQRSERKKWVHCFESVTAILFLAAISGYDQCLIEDKDSNQIQEALMLFDSICNSQWFVKTSMILFLNKVDLFKEKILHSPVKRFFPDYEGEEGNYNQAREFLKGRFLKLNRSGDKEIYTHFTTAVDTLLLKVVMASVTDIIVTRNLQTIIF